MYFGVISSILLVSPYLYTYLRSLVLLFSAGIFSSSLSSTRYRAKQQILLFPSLFSLHPTFLDYCFAWQKQYYTQYYSTLHITFFADDGAALDLTSAVPWERNKV